jgi:hypothetical protein
MNSSLGEVRQSRKAQFGEEKRRVPRSMMEHDLIEH